MKILNNIILAKRFSTLCGLSILLSLLSACASPAHKNTWYSPADSRTINVNVYSPNSFELDGFMTDSAGLEQQVASLKKAYGITSMVIHPKGDASDFDLAIAVAVGEKNGLKTFCDRIFFNTVITTKGSLLN